MNMYLTNACDSSTWQQDEYVAYTSHGAEALL